jgi:hypothetical protein
VVRTAHRKQESGAAFTLVELLVVVLLLTILTGSVVAAVGGGLRVWRRLQDERYQAQWVLLSFQQMRRDFKNMRRFEAIPFEGTHKSVAFAAARPAAGEVYTMVELTYYHDVRHKRLCRASIPYPELKRRRAVEVCESIIEDIDTLKFSYLKAPTETNTASWVSHWKGTELPRAIKCRFRRKSDRLSKPAEQELIVPIPLGTGLLEDEAV